MSNRIVDEKAEEATLAALLVDPSQIPMVAHRLGPDAFAVPANRKLFGGMVRLSEAQRRVDAITLGNEGIDAGYVLDNLAGTEAHDLDEYVQLLLDASFRRRIDEHGSSLKQLARTAKDPTSIIGELQSFNMSLADEAQDSRLIGPERAVEMYAAELAARRTQGLGLSYGIPSLDEVIQPVEGGDLVIVAARPMIGKTTLAENIVDHWALDADKPVLFVSLEMRLSKLMDRGVSRWSGVPSQRLLRGVTTHDEDVLIADAMDRRKMLNIWYVDDPSGTTASVRAAAARVGLVSNGLTGIVVDYLQILKDAGDQETQRVTRISRTLKGIAREFDVPMIVLSQLSRQSEYRQDPHPRLHDLRESGAIEQDADVVFGLYRPRGSGILDLDILKNRQGPSGTRVPIRFDFATLGLGGDEDGEYGYEAQEVDS